jgi:hypothetical protein
MSRPLVVRDRMAASHVVNRHFEVLRSPIGSLHLRLEAFLARFLGWTTQIPKADIRET